MIRMLRNNSELIGSTEQSEYIKDKLVERYCPNIIEQQIPGYDLRTNYLTTTREKLSKHNVTFVTSFDPSMTSLENTGLKYYVKRRLTTGPRICYKATPTIRKILTRAAVDIVLPNNESSEAPTNRNMETSVITS